MEKRPALGKGLSALIPETPATQAAGPGPVEIEIDSISPNPQQPRTHIDDARLDELADSIRANGVIQPILVRRIDTGFRIIAGERRWRAAKKVGLKTVPVVVRETIKGGDKEILELALIENLQREDLNPIEEAVAYQRLIEDHALTQEEIAAAVGKDRSSIANFIRLLKLDEQVRGHVVAGALAMGHARALLSVAEPGDQRRIAAEIIEKGLSVRQAEVLAKRPPAREPHQRQTRVDSPKDVHTKDAEEKLRFALGTRVNIARKGEGGTIEIAFGSEAELIRLFEHLTAP